MSIINNLNDEFKYIEIFNKLPSTGINLFDLLKETLPLEKYNYMMSNIMNNVEKMVNESLQNDKQSDEIYEKMNDIITINYTDIKMFMDICSNSGNNNIFYIFKNFKPIEYYKLQKDIYLYITEMINLFVPEMISLVLYDDIIIPIKRLPKINNRNFNQSISKKIKELLYTNIFYKYILTFNCLLPSDYDLLNYITKYILPMLFNKIDSLNINPLMLLDPLKCIKFIKRTKYINIEIQSEILYNNLGKSYIKIDNKNIAVRIDNSIDTNGYLLGVISDNGGVIEFTNDEKEAYNNCIKLEHTEFKPKHIPIEKIYPIYPYIKSKDSFKNYITINMITYILSDDDINRIIGIGSNINNNRQYIPTTPIGILTINDYLNIYKERNINVYKDSSNDIIDW